MVLPFGIDYLVEIERQDDSSSPAWYGTGQLKSAREDYFGPIVAFTLSSGFVSLSAADPSNAMAKSRVSNYPVGHALGQLLKVGDRLRVQQNGCGQWTYSLERAGELIIGQGCLIGAYGSFVSFDWPVPDDWAGRSAGNAPNPKAAQHVAVQLAGKRFELAVNQDLWEEPYYVRCLKFGDYFGIPGHHPEIAFVKSQSPEPRQAMRSFLDFEEKFIAIYIDFHQRAFPSGPYADNSDRMKMSSEEFETLRKRIFRIRDAMVDALYRDFDMVKPWREATEPTVQP
jgi:hypothetical protein